MLFLDLRRLCREVYGLTNIIVAFPKLEEAKKLRNLLVRNGYDVSAVCTTGEQALYYADDFVNGILLCSYKLPDMMYLEIKEYMPKGFEMIVLVSENQSLKCKDLMVVTMPFAIRDFLNTVDMAVQSVICRKRKMRQHPAKRNDNDRQLINEVKSVLMERNHMTEEEAHRYIQKCSMESGTNLVETARMLLAMAEARL